MKALILAAFLVLASSNVYLEANELGGIGRVCQSNGGFNITNFTVLPFPPVQCYPQTVTVTGTFTTAACPNLIHAHTVLNQRTGTDQDISLPGTCYTAGQTETITVNVDNVICVLGSYQTLIYVNQLAPQKNLACWEYQYSF